MSMYSLKSYALKKDEYNYLLPVLKGNLNNSTNGYYFVGDADELDDMLPRLKGLYDYYDEYNPIIHYNCFKNGSLEPFRKEVTQ